MVSFRYHGNYVGPGWSAGKYQASVRRSKVRPIDEFDRTAQEHDAAYATPGSDLKKADYKFYRSNIGQGWKRSIAAVAVGAQGLLRSSSQNEKNMANRYRSRSRSPRTPTPRGRNVVLVPETPRSSRSVRERRQARIQARRIQLQRSPGFMRGGRKKSANKFGASTSKSAGFFSGGTRKTNLFDKHAKTGVVICLEKGGVAAGSAVSKVQAFALGHATSPVPLVIAGMGHSLVKAVFARMGRDIKDFNDLIVLTQDRPMEMDITYIPGVTGEVRKFFSILANATTYNSLAAQVEGELNLILQNNETYHMKGLRLRFLALATTPPIGGETIVELDLSKARFSFHVKSSLKLQNRTINASGNDESDDVDNVPLYGKSYFGSGNGFRIADQFLVPEAASNYGLIVNGFTTGPNVEPGLKSQVKGCKIIGKAHLDPGQIKTSVLTYTRTIYFDKLLKELKVGAAAPAAAQHTLSLGKARVFHLEKMIQSVGTDDVNAIKLAYEVDIKQGMSMTAPKFTTSSVIAIPNPL